MNHERHLELVEVILTGHSYNRQIDDGIVGDSDYETQQKRAEWVCRLMPQTANLNGVEWDGVKRLGKRDR